MSGFGKKAPSSSGSDTEGEEILSVWGLTSEDLEGESDLEGVSYEVVCAWCFPGTWGSHGICEEHAAQLWQAR